MRDTDKDWLKIGATEPYFGVLVSDQNRTKNINPEAIARLYETGVQDIEFVADALRRVGVIFPVRNALDFGCGVGRLLIPMSRLSENVTGIDIAPGMRDRAREACSEQGVSNFELVDCLDKAQTFDWINSYIVLQHIAPERGYAIIANLMRHLNIGGAVSLQLTTHRTNEGRPLFNDGRSCKMLLGDVEPEVGTISMFDYDLNTVLAVLKHVGHMDQWQLRATDHWGSHGVWIFGRRN